MGTSENLFYFTENTNAVIMISKDRAKSSLQVHSLGGSLLPLSISAGISNSCEIQSSELLISQGARTPPGTPIYALSSPVPPSSLSGI